jgi:hypothetical protein
MGLTEVIEIEKRFVVKYKPDILSKGYSLSGSVSKVVLCDMNPGNNRDDYCIVAHISPLDLTPKILPFRALQNLESVLPKSFENYNVYMRYGSKK